MEVHLSKTNHPVPDICDHLQGRYPKDFKFVGWHPFCRCITTSILDLSSSPKQIENTPKQFNDWVKDNAERIEEAEQRGTSPYFVRDNRDAVEKALEKKTPQQIAAKRHAARTPEQINSIQQDWNERRLKNLSADIDNGYLPKELKAKFNDLLANNTPKQFKNINAQIAFFQQRAKQHINRGIDKVKNIVAQWKERIDSRTIAKLIDSSVVPEMDYRTKLPKRATLKDKLDNAIRGGIYYQGESGNIASAFRPFLGKLDDKSAIQLLIERLKGYYSYGNHDIVELPAIEHLMNLRAFKDVDKIHPIWRKRYNELIDELNAYDYKKGVRDIVSKIEEAHNIMKLSTNPKAVEFGLNKLSHRTPYQIFDEFEKAIPGFSKSCPKKEFFDAFSEYIPLFTGNEAGGAHYSRARKHVIISLEEDAERLINSVWYRDGLFYHEYGHAYDYLNNLQSNDVLKKLYQKWKDKIKVDNGIAIENSIKAKLKPHYDAFDDWWETSDVKKKHDEACGKARIGREYDKAREERKIAYNYERQKVLGNLEEQIGCLSDCLNAFINGSRIIGPRYHTRAYFSDDNLQLAEFIAHCTECFWSGNKYFKELAPELYDEMVKWAKKAFMQK